MDLNRDRFLDAPNFGAYLESVEKNADLWRSVYQRVRLPEDFVQEARAIPGAWHLVALSEDWCGDAVNTLPVVARLAEAAGWDFRVMSRDENDDLMSEHLTDGRSRSIPIVIVSDEDFTEVGWWGPRPGEIQTWIMEEGLAMASPDRYKVVRRWYAKDRGRATVRELLEIFTATA
jgi:hypothetical protein